MLKHSLLLLCTILVYSFSARAETFSKLQGTYQILSCQNLGANPSEDLCQYDTMIVQSSSYATAIYFYTGEWGANLVRSFGFPASTDNSTSEGIYEERGDTYASYIKLSDDYKESTILEQLKDNQFHLIRQQSSASFQSDDKFELVLKKISNDAPELPNTPDPNDPD